MRKEKRLAFLAMDKRLRQSVLQLLTPADVIFLCVSDRVAELLQREGADDHKRSKVTTKVRPLHAAHAANNGATHRCAGSAGSAAGGLLLRLSSGRFDCASSIRLLRSSTPAWQSSRTDRPQSL